MNPRVAYLARRLRELPMRMVLAKAAKRLAGARKDKAQRRVDADTMTHVASAVEAPPTRLLSVPPRAPATDWLEPVCEHYLAHRFDVLGSGWTHVVHGMRCHGLEDVVFDAAPSPAVDETGLWLEGRVTAANISESRRIWSLVSEDYEPIDWHIDIKSGYRWSETAWYRDVPVAPVRGADIKVPWELARCHHLPQMALLAGWASRADRERLAREFRNQVLDFVAANPPRFGVNWACAMDAGIRVVNWLVAYDLFQAAGTRFDAEFDALFASSVLAHGRHIRANLEGDVEFRGNHYLADIVGLLFCAAYLPHDEETQAWWGFGRLELLREIELQFFGEGTSFEASTGYHRLSAEMAVWAVALIVRLDGADAVPPSMIARLERAAEFVRDTSMPSGHDPQIGDNDSGRLLKVGVRYRWTSIAEAMARYTNLAALVSDHDSRYWLEDQLDHRHVIAAVGGLLSRDDLEERAGEWVDRHLIAALALERIEPVAERDAAARVAIGTHSDWTRVVEMKQALDRDRCVVQDFILGESLTFGPPVRRGYREFGLYVFRSSHFYLAVRCGTVGQGGLGGHAHNDQLGIVLEIEGNARALDPGTYVYTPLRERRNEYRSVNAHNAPRAHSREPGSLDLDLFRLEDPGARCVYFGESGFAGYHDGYGARVWRLVELTHERLTVTDWCEDPEVRLVAPAARSGQPFSPGYGWRERETPQ